MLSACERFDFHPDLTVGVRVRHRRWMLGMSRQALATAVGASEDLIEAYERGERQIGGTLFDSVCGALAFRRAPSSQNPQNLKLHTCRHAHPRDARDLWMNDARPWRDGRASFFGTMPTFLADGASLFH